jgi:hypothetical protein
LGRINKNERGTTKVHGWVELEIILKVKNVKVMFKRRLGVRGRQKGGKKGGEEEAGKEEKEGNNRNCKKRGDYNRIDYTTRKGWAKCRIRTGQVAKPRHNFIKIDNDCICSGVRHCQCRWTGMARRRPGTGFQHLSKSCDHGCCSSYNNDNNTGI